MFRIRSRGVVPAALILGMLAGCKDGTVDPSPVGDYCTSAPEGAACNDQDPATYADRCVGQSCEGTRCPCVHGGTCASESGVCSCPPGFFGSSCQLACACTNGGVCDDGAGGTGACCCPTGTFGPTCTSPPQLGLYVVGIDGSGLRLVADTGAVELTHARRLPDTEWVAATRYHQDPDGNGLAMENEAGFGAYYRGTEVIVFPLSDPSTVTVVAGGPSGGMAANPSWTDDGKLLYVFNPVFETPTTAEIRRTTFAAVPVVASTAVIPLPSDLVVPVDPHQTGPSDSTGKLVITATYRLMPANLWMRPVWLLPASGESSWQATTLVGCPVCPSQVPAGCCGWAEIDDVLGTNDARLNHAGTQVNWMQQSPSVTATIGTVVLHPQRQQIRTLSQAGQSDLTPAFGVAATTSFTYGEWRADDQEMVNWSIELEGSVLRQNLYRMTADGSFRERVPLPRELCPLHPSYINPTEIVFNAWRCVPPHCSCDVPPP